MLRASSYNSVPFLTTTNSFRGICKICLARFTAASQGPKYFLAFLLFSLDTTLLCLFLFNDDAVLPPKVLSILPSYTALFMPWAVWAVDVWAVWEGDLLRRGERYDGAMFTRV